MLPEDLTVIVPILTLLVISVGLTHGIITATRAQRLRERNQRQQNQDRQIEKVTPVQTESLQGAGRFVS